MRSMRLQIASCVLLVALPALHAPVAAQPPSDESPAAASAGLREVRGKRIHVDVSGPASAPALLYLHGGPGTGSFDFTLHQGKRLSEKLRLVALDQRGVLRSDPFAPGEPFSLDDLVEDCEALRLQLGIDRWTVLGHSFGGYVELLYALKYPQAIHGLIFENPTFDFGSSARELLRGIALRNEALAKPAEAEEARRAAESSLSTPEIWNTFSRAANRLGDARNDLYVHGPEKDFFTRLVQASPIPPEWWSRGHAGENSHQARLYAEGKVFDSLLDRLGGLQMPALLLRGRYDRVTAPDQVLAFERQVKKGRTIVFENSSHFARFEEPDLYARTVIDFTLEVARNGN